MTDTNGNGRTSTPADTPPDTGGGAGGGERPSLGILQCGHTPEELLGLRYANYPDLFVQMLGPEAFDYRVWAVVDGEFPPDARACDAWLITGSRHGVYEPHDWIPPLESLIRDIRDAERPLVGICFGHQIIAQALGGRVEKFAGGWSVGRVEYRLDLDGDGEGAAREAVTLPLMAYHQDQVIEPPPGAVSRGASNVCRHAALAIGDTIRTLQPHPEFDAAFVAGLLDTRGRVLPPERYEQAVDSLKEADDVEPARAEVGRLIREFLRSGAARHGAPATPDESSGSVGEAPPGAARSA